MAELHVLRVFVAPDGTGGNPLGVFLDGAAVTEGRRQAVAADLGFSETVFVDDPRAGRLRIFTPAAELPFAGHPLVGTSWLLARERTAVAVLRPPAGEVPTFLDGDGVTWIRGRAEW
ncbi:MAG TPA: PhzF family phenazine biosynthesis protein, partial [Actinomycetota bacterium]|nr:PhzF family phenazine biosynthesis protein [Actinomycetota bacterium]